MPTFALKLVDDHCDLAREIQPDPQPVLPSTDEKLAEILRRKSGLSIADLAKASALQARQDVQLGTILTAHRLVSEADLLSAMSEQFSAPIADLGAYPPSADMLAGISPEICLKHGFLPWQQVGGTTLIALSDPSKFEAIQALLPADFGPTAPAISTFAAIQRAISSVWSRQLSNIADQKCPPDFSCRSWARPLGRPMILGCILTLITLGLLLPVPSMWLMFGWVMLNLLAMNALRLTALVQQFKNWRRTHNGVVVEEETKFASIGRMPKVSVLVPLYREEAILPKLIARLATTDYPKELLDICLVLEESDIKTQQAVARTNLPSWMRVINVPESKLKTKPRAMNYALDFCRGEIIGIYDAEDAPESDQIQRIVDHFRRVGPEIACIQSYLDYYNSKQNWLSRCFTIEYAIWFRVVLQGVERMRLPVPLGGTSVFFRREALEKLGAWDAHNVTEDADLGMRLARFGYRCAFEPTTTYEEANCHTVPWIKQRSRWLKGYAMTWITHMRDPRALWKDLGPKGFLTFHVILLGTLSSFLLAPAIWSFWLISFGFTPVFAPLLPDLAWSILGVTFVGSEIILGVLGVVATSGQKHRFLIPWVPSMVAYWPLGTIAVYKAMYELLLAPFYWDKTQHGISKNNL